MNQNLEVTYPSPGELAPYARNARTHTRDQIQQISRSIQAFGFINPVIIDETGMIVAGHARVLAARELGLARVPVIRVEHLSEAEKRAYILADNKLAENAGWDTDLLRIELEYLTQIDIDVNVDLTGFSAPEIDLLFSPVTEDPSPEEPPPPLPDLALTVSRAGDVWQLGPHRIICGDCRDSEVIDRLMNGQRAAMIITDPPYNVAIPGHVCGQGKHQHTNFAMASGEMSSETFTDFLTASLSELARVSKDGGVHFIFMDWRHLPELFHAGQNVYDVLLNLCVWAKTNGGMGSLYRSQHELVLVFRKGKSTHRNNVELGKHGRYRTNVWTYPGVNSFSPDREKSLSMHPTVKPLQMIADAILDVSCRGDIVLDGFLGSGTTVLAAEQTGRIGYGVEFDPRYVDVTVRRWMDATGKEAVHADSGHSFSEFQKLRTDSPLEER